MSSIHSTSYSDFLENLISRLAPFHWTTLTTLRLSVICTWLGFLFLIFRILTHLFGAQVQLQYSRFCFGGLLESLVFCHSAEIWLNCFRFCVICSYFLSLFVKWGLKLSKFTCFTAILKSNEFLNFHSNSFIEFYRFFTVSICLKR